MGKLPTELQESDLDHIIGFAPVTLTGAYPASVQGKTYEADIQTITLGRTIEASGVEAELTTTIRIRASKYDVLPSLGCVLTSGGGHQYKVMEIQYDDEENPVVATYGCVNKYSAE